MNQAGHEDSISVLVRSATDGLRYVSKTHCQTYTMSTKLERQPDFGADSLTKSELAREWISTMVRPGSHLLRTRVDALTGSLCAFEMKTLKDLTQDGVALNFRPAEQLGNLHTLFQALGKLEAGQYIMRHDHKMGAFVRVERASTEAKGGCYDLHATYNAVIASEDRACKGTPAWNPIDCDVLLP